MHVGLKTWQSFKEYFLQAYRCYQIRKKATSVTHGYGASENHAHETDAQVMTVDALQALENANTEDKEAMEQLTRKNLTLSHSLTQAGEKILVLYKELQAL